MERTSRKGFHQDALWVLMKKTNKYQMGGISMYYSQTDAFKIKCLEEKIKELEEKVEILLYELGELYKEIEH